MIETLNLNVNNTKISLPQWYTTVPPTTKRNFDNPLLLVNDTYGNSYFNVFEETKEWVEHVQCNVKGDILPWAVLYSRKEENTEIKKLKSTSVLLPLLQEDINSPAMVRHAMDIIVTLLKNINSEQIPVITSDQPVYALAKRCV